MKFRIGNFIVSFNIYRLPKTITIGVTNQTKDRKFILFADYDLVDFSVVLEDAKYIYEEFDIKPILILKTKEFYNVESEKIVGSYHLINFDKFEFDELIKILKKLRCDNHFKKGYRYQYRNWVLRILEKKSFDGKVKSNQPKYKMLIKGYSKREGSLGHILLYEKLYNINIRRFYKKLDNNKEVEIIRYVTS